MSMEWRGGNHIVPDYLRDGEDEEMSEKPTRYSVDVTSYELACYWLPLTGPTLTGPELEQARKELAQCIQEAIEDWLRERGL